MLSATKSKLIVTVEKAGPKVLNKKLSVSNQAIKTKRDDSDSAPTFNFHSQGQ